MQGKTADEVAQMTTDFYNEAIQLRNAQYQAPAPQPQQPSNVAQPPDPNLMYTNASEYQRQLIAFQNSTLQSAMGGLAGPVSQQLSDTAKALSKMGTFKQVWDRHEPEIERELAGIPPHMRNQVIYDKAAEIVRSRHLDEIVEERIAARMAAGGSGTERSSHAGGPNLPPVDKLDEVYDGNHPFFVNARTENVSKQMIREHCKKLGISIEEYVGNATAGVVVLARNGFERRAS